MQVKISEKVKQLTASDSEENGLEVDALMTGNIIVFPRVFKWKLVNTVQRIQLRNPTENRFAIKVVNHPFFSFLTELCAKYA